MLTEKSSSTPDFRQAKLINQFEEYVTNKLLRKFKSYDYF